MPQRSRTVALTGSTGFIGRALLERVLATGAEVRALVRRASVPRMPSDPRTRIVVGDLGDERALEELVDGADSVVHCAGSVRGWRAGFDETNIEGTRRLARAAASSERQPHFLLVSSLAAREPQLSEYAASKRGGELALAQEAGAMPYRILRPPAVYGPGDRELLPLLQWVRHGVAPVLGPPDARFSLVYVDDLADGIVALQSTEAGSGSTYEIHDGREGGYGWSDVIEIMAGLSGRRARRLPVPTALARAVAALNLVRGRLFRSPPMLTPGKIRELTHRNWVCDDEPLRRDTHWRPRVSLEEGLRRTLFASNSDQTPSNENDHER